jgi:hypothetical protein
MTIEEMKRGKKTMINVDLCNRMNGHFGPPYD